VIEYRSFRNSDPPQVCRLWNQAQLGPRAAGNLSTDAAFESLNFSHDYFDRAGLILAVDESNTAVGYVHAGFGCTSDQSALSVTSGVICAVVVHPDHRRQGIGRELVSRAEAFLRGRGAEDIYAGPSPLRDPFNFGMYGGAQPVGFQKSDTNAAPFFLKLGYQPVAEYRNLSRQMGARDPVSFRLTMLRRKWELVLVDRPDPCSWWWMSHFGRMDALYCVLIPQGGGTPVAGVTIAGLDTYMPTWGQQAIGMCDLWVAEDDRRKGFGQALVLEVIRRLRQETVRKVTANVPADSEAGMAVFRSAGFEEEDQATVFKTPPAA
jgi:ribosomal protein S18 acetylase RimI-like enzyme